MMVHCMLCSEEKRARELHVVQELGAGVPRRRSVHAWVHLPSNRLSRRVGAAELHPARGVGHEGPTFCARFRGHRRCRAA